MKRIALGMSLVTCLILGCSKNKGDTATPIENDPNAETSAGSDTGSRGGGEPGNAATQGEGEEAGEDVDGPATEPESDE